MNPTNEAIEQTCGKRRHRALVFVFFNIAAVAVVALFHPFSSAADHSTALGYRSFFCWIAIETFVLFLPGVVVYALLRRHFPRVAAGLCVALTLVISAIYFLDLAVFIAIREHFLSEVFFLIVASVLPFIFDYISTLHLIAFAAICIGWLVTQIIFWKLSGYSGRKQEKSQLSPATVGALAMVGLIPIIASLVPAGMHFQRTIAEIPSASARHPITATGYFAANRAPRLEETNFDTVRGRAWMLQQGHRPAEYAKQFASFSAHRIDDDGGQLPDVMIIVSECLRSDIITPKTTPNIHHWAEQGLWLKQHYSSGNQSRFGFFGLMYGLEACWYFQKANLPVTLFDALEEVGYTTAFFGRDCFHTFGMEDFCDEQCFDMHDFDTTEDVVECDKAVCRSAAEFFDRKGRYAENPDAPRLAIVYLYAPHEYVHEAEDDIHTPADSLAPEAGVHLKARFAKFMNSIHFVDRTIGPLLNKDRITFILGDHGESFGEDRRSWHGTAMSTVQVQTCGVGFGPGIERQTITKPTSHCDILPTLAQILGIQYSNVDLYPGDSLLKPIPDDRIVGVRGFHGAQYLFVRPGREQEDAELGYQGFFSWRENMLAPGATVDISGETLPARTDDAGRWSHADLMLAWLENQVGADFAKIPVDPEPLLRESLTSDDPAIRLQSIALIRGLGDQGILLLDDLEARLSDPDENIREKAMQLIHELQRARSRDGA